MFTHFGYMARGNGCALRRRVIKSRSIVCARVFKKMERQIEAVLHARVGGHVHF